MPDLLLQVAGLLAVAVVAFTLGWSVRGQRKTRSPQELAEWQVLEIAYRDKARTQELNRFLWSSRYSSYDEAMRQAKRLEGEDTLKNRFDREYLAVQAP